VSTEAGKSIATVAGLGAGASWLAGGSLLEAASAAAASSIGSTFLSAVAAMRARRTSRALLEHYLILDSPTPSNDEDAWDDEDESWAGHHWF
jgi:hypothetical protein